MTIKINLYGKEQNITASKAVLNFLSSALSNAGDEQLRRGHDALAARYDNVSDAIYDALKNAGYYDN